MKLHIVIQCISVSTDDRCDGDRQQDERCDACACTLCVCVCVCVSHLPSRCGGGGGGAQSPPDADDDGYGSIHWVGASRWKRYKFPCSFYILTHFVASNLELAPKCTTRVRAELPTLLQTPAHAELRHCFMTETSALVFRWHHWKFTGLSSSKLIYLHISSFIHSFSIYSAVDWIIFSVRMNMFFTRTDYLFIHLFIQSVSKSLCTVLKPTYFLFWFFAVNWWCWDQPYFKHAAQSLHWKYHDIYGCQLEFQTKNGMMYLQNRHDTIYCINAANVFYQSEAYKSNTKQCPLVANSSQFTVISLLFWNWLS